RPPSSSTAPRTEYLSCRKLLSDMRHPGGWKTPAGGGIVPHHPISHTPAHARRGKPTPKKPPPPAKAHKKPAPAKKPKKPPAKKPARKWSPGRDVACCAAEALGTLVIAS